MQGYQYRGSGNIVHYGQAVPIQLHAVALNDGRREHQQQQQLPQQSVSYKTLVLRSILAALLVALQLGMIYFGLCSISPTCKPTTETKQNVLASAVSSLPEPTKSLLMNAFAFESITRTAPPLKLTLTDIKRITLSDAFHDPDNIPNVDIAIVVTHREGLLGCMPHEVEGDPASVLKQFVSEKFATIFVLETHLSNFLQLHEWVQQTKHYVALVDMTGEVRGEHTARLIGTRAARSLSNNRVKFIYATHCDQVPLDTRHSRYADIATVVSRLVDFAKHTPEVFVWTPLIVENTPDLDSLAGARLHGRPLNIPMTRHLIADADSHNIPHVSDVSSFAESHAVLYNDELLRKHEREYFFLDRFAEEPKILPVLLRRWGLSAARLNNAVVVYDSGREGQGSGTSDRHLERSQKHLQLAAYHRAPAQCTYDYRLAIQRSGINTTVFCGGFLAKHFSSRWVEGLQYRSVSRLVPALTSILQLLGQTVSVTGNEMHISMDRSDLGPVRLIGLSTDATDRVVSGENTQRILGDPKVAYVPRSQLLQRVMHAAHLPPLLTLQRSDGETLSIYPLWPVPGVTLEPVTIRLDDTLLSIDDDAVRRAVQLIVKLPPPK
ncbi:MAG: hypothetical protein MHM6MM_002169 [Cercozoa sp. M6MM]